MTLCPCSFGAARKIDRHRVTPGVGDDQEDILRLGTHVIENQLADPFDPFHVKTAHRVDRTGHGEVHHLRHRRQRVGASKHFLGDGVGVPGAEDVHHAVVDHRLGDQFRGLFDILALGGADLVEDRLDSAEKCFVAFHGCAP